MRDFHRPGRSPVMATGGMVATSHPLAALAGIEALRAGGSAADAAVAAAFVLGIAEPQMAGIGGDMFALVAPRPGAPVAALNGSGRAPSGLDTAALRDAGHGAIPPQSALAVTVPGAVAGFAALLERFGRRGLDAALAPAIGHAEAGIPVAARVAFDWARSADRLQGPARDHYLLDGAPPMPGALFRCPAQAAVLRRIAAEGPDGFYTGPVAADMVAGLRAAGGPHTEADFAAAATAAEWGAPLSGPFAGASLIEHPPNGQGATALLLARILSHFDLAALDPDGADRVHLEAEATKLAYDARNRFLGDPAHSVRLDHMLDPATADRFAALIDPVRVMPDPPAAAESVHRETVYVTAVDADRMAVSLIYSIFHDFGSGIAAPGTGILFHNRGAGFALAQGHPNDAGPGRRPMHTIIPALLAEEGCVALSFGVMGGAYQPVGHLRLLSNLRLHGMDLQTAIDAPRAFWDGSHLRLERGYRAAVRDRLAAMGHAVTVPDVPIGGAQAIAIGRDGVLIGGSDPRKDGCALGY